jgi:hypothetical protein
MPDGAAAAPQHELSVDDARLLLIFNANESFTGGNARRWSRVRQR